MLQVLATFLSGGFVVGTFRFTLFESRLEMSLHFYLPRIESYCHEHTSPADDPETAR